MSNINSAVRKIYELEIDREYFKSKGVDGIFIVWLKTGPKRFFYHSN